MRGTSDIDQYISVTGTPLGYFLPYGQWVTVHDASVKGASAYFTYRAYSILFVTALCHLDRQNHTNFRPTLLNDK